MTIRLHQGDCLDVMRRLPNGCVDAVVTDPPYGQTNESYDSGIGATAEVWRECSRVCKPNAGLLCITGSPTYHRIASAIEVGGWKVRQMWAWVYRDGLITSAWPSEGFDRLAPAMDPICYATRGKVLLSLMRTGKEWDREKGRRDPFQAPRYSARSNNCKRRAKAAGHWPRCVAADAVPGFEYFSLARTNGGASRNEGHPNQKPLDLMTWLITKLPGLTILDPFMGSGTTGVACAGLDRDFIGIDIDPSYVAIARRRIKAEQARVQVSA